MPSSEDDMHNM